MCGITGIFEYRGNASVDRDVLLRMTDTLRHRGPDASGVYVDARRTVGLGHRRLSIIDLSTGDQPMTDGGHRYQLVFNGEIYNYRELRQILQSKGHRFQTTSDTEVIILQYAQDGERGFSQLNGIFSFGLYDTQEHTLILARDPFGVKPLYYAVVRGALLFGSEIKALLAHPLMSPTVDLGALNSFLTYRYNPSPQTLLQGIMKLPPGHLLHVKEGEEPWICAYQSECPVTNARITEQEAEEEYAQLLTKAITRQMVSDVPVGLMLSGGIDSAVIGYHMSNVATSKVKTFTVGFSGKGEYNELEDARATARYLGTDHYETVLSARKYLDFFPQSFLYTEEPIAEPTIPALYYVSQLAGQQVKVVLAGQGADEPLAGYDRYIGESYISKFSGVLRLFPLEAITATLPRNERLKRAAFASRFDDGVDRIMALYTIFTPSMKQSLLLPAVQEAMGDVDRVQVERLHAQAGKLKGTLAKLLYMDARLSLADNLLLFGDKMSMANSLEMRVPFLDLELMRFLESLPSSYKLRGRTGKYLHKRVLRRWLPPAIIARKKRGFVTPMDPWLQGSLADSANRMFNERDSAARRYFSLPAINEMIEKHKSRRENYRRHIFALLCFELWHRIIVEGRSPGEFHLDTDQN